MADCNLVCAGNGPNTTFIRPRRDPPSEADMADFKIQKAAAMSWAADESDRPLIDPKTGQIAAEWMEEPDGR